MEEHRLRVIESRVMTRIFGERRDAVTGEWRKLHSEELRDLYSSPNTIRRIKSRRMRWAEYVARMGEKMNAYVILAGKPEGNRPLGNQDIGGWIILRWIKCWGTIEWLHNRWPLE
jgi:hypothetical protein